MAKSCEKIKSCSLIFIIIFLFVMFLYKEFELQKCKKQKNKKFNSPTKNNNTKTKTNVLTTHPVKLTLYKSNHCYHCKQFEPKWKSIKEIINNKYTRQQIVVEEVECSGGDSRCNTPYVRGVPTLILYKNNKSPYVYDNSRTVKDVLVFVDRHMEH